MLSIIPSPWLKKILKFDLLEISRKVQFSYFLSIIPSPPTVEENFEIWPSGKLQNGPIFLRSINHSFTMIDFFLDLTFQKSSRIVQFSCLLIIPSTWLKKILRFNILKSSRMDIFSYFLSIIPSSPTVEESFEIWPSGKL